MLRDIDFGSQGSASFFDADNDGDLDLIVTFLALNTHPSKDPLIMFSPTHFHENVGNASMPEYDPAIAELPSILRLFYSVGANGIDDLQSMAQPTCAEPSAVDENHGSGTLSCATCPGGTEPDAHRLKCVACALGMNSTTGLCVSCAKGKTSSTDRTSYL